MHQTNQSTYPAHAQTTAAGGGPATTVVGAMAVHSHHHTTPVTNENNAHVAGPDSDHKKKKGCARAWLIGLGTIGTVAMTVILLLLLRKNWSTSSNQEQRATTPLPSPAPTAAGDEECRRKRIKITEICNASGLDSELVELKVLVNDQPYWPKQVCRISVAFYVDQWPSTIINTTFLQNSKCDIYIG